MTKIRLSFLCVAKTPTGRVWVSNWPALRVDLEARNVNELRQKAAAYHTSADFKALVAATKSTAAGDGDPRISISCRAIDRKFGNFDVQTKALDDEYFERPIDDFATTLPAPLPQNAAA